VTEFLGTLVSITFLMQVVRITMTYALTAVGGAVSERSGVTNIALEGIMLMGAFAAGAGAYESGNSLVVAVLCGMAAGVGTAALYALVVVTFKADQIVSGVAINMLALAITPYFLKVFYNSSSNSPNYEGLGANIIGNFVFFLAVGMMLLVHVLIGRTRWGLRVRAVGDHPEAAHTLGVSVDAIRWQAVLWSGALAGLGGAWLALTGSSFVAGMSAGRGYIALATVIMGNWRPLWAAAACLMFGFAEAIQVTLQTFDIGIPNEVVQTFPYVLTMITLAGFIGRSRAPAAIGKPYETD
jgi:general nucleoside transport system permease protein